MRLNAARPFKIIGMKKTILILTIIIQATAAAYGQSVQSVWTFGDKAGLDFSTGTAVPAANNLFPGEEGCASISDASGQLLFYSDGFWVWDRQNHLMPRLTGGTTGISAPVALSIGYPPLMPYTGAFATQATAIAGAPAHPGIYYLFSLNTTGQLFYSMIDMSLNGGYGDLISGKTNILIGGGFTEKMTVVNGCSNIWLVSRALAANQYRAYEINDTGIVTTPVVSTCGLLPLSWCHCGVIKFSPDHTRMAAACNDASTSKGGLELYDFDGVTGKLTNAAILDSSSTLGYYYGACFSSDNSKLYATKSSFTYGGAFHPGELRQFNTGLSTIAAIIASNTLVFTDNVHLPDNFGDLKRGEDGKIYIGSGRPHPPYTPYMHCINTPNAAGTGCTFVSNAVALPSGIWSYRGLPNDIVLLPLPDTVRTARQVSVCFKDTAVLTADTGKFYQWTGGATSRKDTIHNNGIYIVGYINASCQYEIDTFKVNFVHAPLTSPDGYSCTGEYQGVAWIKPLAGDTAAFTFTWLDETGNILQQHATHLCDTIRGLDTGTYSIHVQIIGGCDTILHAHIIPLPMPQITVTSDSVLCLGLSGLFTATTDGYVWSWSFGDGTYSSEQSIAHQYHDTGTYFVSFATTNIEGCTDTSVRKIAVRDFRISLTADKDLVNKGEQVLLQSSASVSYTVTAWLPGNFFANQAATDQTIAMDTTREFMVIGHSSDGCYDSATVVVNVNPVVYVPSAFSPNGDGLNDHFRPKSADGPILIRNFEIYNRWGQMVFWGYGATAAEGWDGTFHGIPAEIGAYFYTIDIETPTGGTIALKGDVTLVR